MDDRAPNPIQRHLQQDRVVVVCIELLFIELEEECLDKNSMYVHQNISLGGVAYILDDDMVLYSYNAAELRNFEKWVA